MAVLLFTEISDLALDRVQVNVATDPAFTAAVIARAINDAYADVFEISGGGIISATHTTIWEVYDTTAYSTKASITNRIREVVRAYETEVNTVTGGASAAYRILERVEQERVLYLQRMGRVLNYATTKCYSITRINETDETRIPRLRLDVYPAGLTAFYPIDYIPQFTEIDAATNTQPSCTDLESRDIALLTAARLAPLAGRHDLVPSIMADVSERTARALEARFASLADARQDR